MASLQCVTRAAVITHLIYPQAVSGPDPERMACLMNGADEDNSNQRGAERFAHDLNLRLIKPRLHRVLWLSQNQLFTGEQLTVLQHFNEERLCVLTSDSPNRLQQSKWWINVKLEQRRDIFRLHLQAMGPLAALRHPLLRLEQREV
ncbi:hypothetical protein WMY93_012809 [Mugilogobius chulae]|uniref:Uncharacterized protein n=1 Tax=Mugilogobius chulae TaxID=88201 RepID=A0AAW0NYA7_9GOBI